MMPLEQRIEHYKGRIKSIWHLRNGAYGLLMQKDIRLSINFSIRRIREYKERIGDHHVAVLTFN